MRMEGVAQPPSTALGADRHLVPAATTLALLCGPLVALLSPLKILALLTGAGVALAVALRPPLAAYFVIAATPLVAGIERGQVIPLLRPSEAILGIVVAGLAARGLVELLRGAGWRPRPNAVEWSMVVLIVGGSIVPLLWMVARGRQIAPDDLFYASYLWKYAMVYLVVRASVRTEGQVRTCLWISMATAAIVAVIAILQTLNLLGVPGLLASVYSPGEGPVTEGARGTSTLSSPFAVADIMIFNLAIAAAWALRGGARRALIISAVAVFVFGTVAAGQISGYLGLGVAVVTVGAITGRLRQVLIAALAVVALAALVLWPVIASRAAQFRTPAGLPASWVGPNGRWENLTTFFWPELFRDFNWVTGVRVAARVPAPEPWQKWVWIESGHTWLLWSGGVVFLLACLAFLGIAIRQVAGVARRRAAMIRVAAIGSLTAPWVNVVLMTFDVHLTLRGSGELNFALLALALTGLGPARRAAPRPSVAAAQTA